MQGICTNGTQTTGTDISPYFTIYNSTGTVLISKRVFEILPADGGGLAWTNLGTPSVTDTISDIGSVPGGTYTAVVVVADNDEDRDGDRLLNTNLVTFEVRADYPVARNRTAESNPTSLTLGDTNVALGADTSVSFGGNDRANPAVKPALRSSLS